MPVEPFWLSKWASHVFLKVSPSGGSPYVFEDARLFIRAETDKEEMPRPLTLCGVSPPGNSTCWSQHSSQPRRGTGQKPSEVRPPKLIIMMVLWDDQNLTDTCTGHLLLSFLCFAVMFFFIVLFIFWIFEKKKNNLKTWLFLAKITK